MFDLERIRARVPLGGLECHPTLESTNTTALTLATSSELATPYLVLAEQQTAGRGRGANQWWSAPGSLTFSVIIEPGEVRLDPPGWPKISLTAALAVCEILRQRAAGSPCGLRWPNDVYVGNRKICGILVEVPAAVRSPRRLVIGIGVNVNNSFRDAPADVQSIGTSLVDLTKTEHDLTDVLCEILTQLWQELVQLPNDKGELAARWKNYCLLSGHTVRIDQGSRITEGRCRGLGPDGCLLVETNAGVQKVYGGVLKRVD